MSLSRVYATSQAFNGGGVVYPVPFGAGNLLDPMTVANDGKFLLFEFPYNPATVDSTLALRFNYDNAIPTAATITQVNYTVRHATSNLDIGLSVNSDIAFEHAGVPAAAVLVPYGTLPTSAHFQTDVVEFSNTGTLPMSVAQLLDILRFAEQGQSVRAEATAIPPSQTWLDYFSTELFFTLPLPAASQPPTFGAIHTNRFSMHGTVTCPLGTMNDFYPLTAWFQYTNMDPSADGFEDLALGQGKIAETDKQILTNTDNSARALTLDVVGTTFSTLNANTTYYARTVVQTADGQFVYSPWAAVTTLQFDNPSSF